MDESAQMRSGIDELNGLRAHRRVLRLQTITVAWMLVELLGSLIAAARAHSVVLTAFGSDSLVELLSAGVVLLQFNQRFHMSRERAARVSGLLLYVLAGVVAFLAAASIKLHTQAEPSVLGIGITFGALVIMPVLAYKKRSLAAETDNRALSSDAVQSATCAYLAAIAFVSLAVQVVKPTRWLDPMAALCVIPLLIMEGRRACRGEACDCC